MVEPTEENVSMVVEITQADPAVARRYLKAKHNDPELAVNALLEGEDISSSETALRWDDSAWMSDRDGGVTGQQSTAFNDSNLRPLGSSAAPTRGSSPVPSLRQPQTKAEEDEEMERALANSRQDLGFGMQESGVVSSGARTQTSFGPATKSHYDNSQWAMVPTAMSTVNEAREIIPDVEPAQRKNVDDEPRFLKHTASGDYLPNLLTIAHSIPMAREVLLSRNHVEYSYGQDADWWRGYGIKLPQIVHTDSGMPAQDSDGDAPNLVAEMQRLVAFLDHSERSYASTETLTRLAANLSRQVDLLSPTPLDQTLCGWEMALSTTLTQEQQQGQPFDRLFHSIIGSNGPDGVQTPHMWSLPLSLPERSPSGQLTLADCMDQTLWDTDADDDRFFDTYMERCAEVLPMRVSDETPGATQLDVTIPTSLYVDKYLKDNIAATRFVRRDMARAKRRISQLEQLQHDLANIKHPDKNENMGALSVLRSAKEYFGGKSREAVLADHDSRGIALPNGTLDLSSQDQALHDSVFSRLSGLWGSVTSKISQLEQEKLEAKDLLSKLSQTQPPELSDSVLKHHYTLRGVATKPNVTYLLRPVSADSASSAMNMSPEMSAAFAVAEDDEPDAPPGWQWWRIQLDPSPLKASDACIHKSISSAPEVIQAVQLEHTSALLVYASDHAVHHPSDPSIPPPLAKFVQDDNALFRGELNGESQSKVVGGGWADLDLDMDGGDRHGRRASAGSTMVNFDDDDNDDQVEDDTLPAYSFTGRDDWATTTTNTTTTMDRAGDNKTPTAAAAVAAANNTASSAAGGHAEWEYGHAGAYHGNWDTGAREVSPEAHEIRLDEDEDARAVALGNGVLAGVGGAEEMMGGGGGGSAGVLEGYGGRRRVEEVKEGRKGG